MVTIQHIAALTKVSTATVSHALNNTGRVSPKMRERVMKVARELNYQPNALARSPFYPAVVRGAEDVLEREGNTLIVGNSDGDIRKEEAYYRTLCAKRVDGLLLITRASVDPPPYLFRHNWEATPVAFINRVYPGFQADSVVVDNLDGSYRAVCHLLDKGHRRIGLVGGAADHVMFRQRHLGYERALRERGLQIEKELMRDARMDAPSGYEETRVLLSLATRPTALFVCNALMTMGALRAIFDLGIRCPGEIALVSFDDLEWFNYIQPRVSAVAQPTYELGARAAERLLRRISEEQTGPPERETLTTELWVRESSVSTWDH